LPITNPEAQPAVVDGVLYLTGLDISGDSVYALSAVNVDTVWRFQASDSPFTSVVAGDSAVYASTYNGKVFALNSSDGTAIWEVATRKTMIGDPIGANGNMVISASDGTIFSSGEELSPGTPVPPTSAIDVSGLEECQPYRSLPAVEMTGTPALSLMPGRWEEFQHQIVVSEIPQGTPAAEEVKAGIRETLVRMEACQNELQSDPRGFFTDDFLRRPGSVWLPDHGIYGDATYVTAPDGGPALDFDDARTLPDGRVAITIVQDYGDDFADGDKFGEFIIFTEQDGNWLVDERYWIVPELNNQG
jgi:hypothetical protein